MYFLLLVLRIPLNPGPNIGYKHSRLSKTLVEKDLEFILSKGSGLVTLNIGFVFLPVKVNPVLEKQSYKRNMLMTCSTGRVEIILTLSAKVVILHL